MFDRFHQPERGTLLCFSAACTGCRGAEQYLGFMQPSRGAGRFLAESEAFKLTAALGDAFYEAIDAPAPAAEYLVVQDLETVEDGVAVEVVNLWVDARSLGALVTLANFDRATNDNVIIPFASGCQSIWTLPYQEASRSEPRAVVGCMDPATRPFLPPDTLSFSVCARRFMELAGHAGRSFLARQPWRAALAQAV
jgi:hypothetical protein